MAGVDIIGRMLGGSTNYLAVAGTSAASMSRSEMGGLLSGLEPHETDFAMARYGIDELSRKHFSEYLLRWILDLAKKENWKQAGEETLTAFAVVAIKEAIDPNFCKTCKGSGRYPHLCLKCAGSGRRWMSNREIADWMRIDESRVRRTWKARYEKVVRHLQTIDSRVNAAVVVNSKTF
jgi:hypothetical protein